ncbi:hypothetical protein HGRIS_004494 [Hohenbuehelia grisea]|uniref:Nicotinamide-nucleotide adenylyltransferase n=1 Tax=Hohenbuehelia grisea TaxID=104357 RepID=A0ABR3JCF6_9AGAR
MLARQVIEDETSKPMMRVLTRSSISSLLQHIQSGMANPPIGLVYTSHDRWPLPPSRQRSAPPCPKRLRISVLDSSFNPPTLAHLALANHPRPRFASSDDDNKHSENEHYPDYDAKLLLLSVRNADKTLKPTDASFMQRIEMMMLLTDSIVAHPSLEHGTPFSGQPQNWASTAQGPQDTHVTEANVAVAIIDEPTFVGKSSALLTFLRDRLASLETLLSGAAPTPPTTAGSPQSAEPRAPDIELTFLVGIDTLERLFVPKYYASSDPTATPEENMLIALRKFMSSQPGGDNARVVCARRIPTSTPSLPPRPSAQSASFDIKPSSTTLVTPSGASASPHAREEPLSSVLESGSMPSDQLQQARMGPEQSIEFLQEFISSGRVAMIDIGENEQTFSSSAVREMISVSSSGRNPDEPHWRSEHAAWRQVVPEQVAQYVLAEGLYAIIQS